MWRFFQYLLKIASGFDRVPEIDRGLHWDKKPARVEENLDITAFPPPNYVWKLIVGFFLSSLLSPSLFPLSLPSPSISFSLLRSSRLGK